MQPNFLSGDQPLEIHRRRLPHWQQNGVCYFVTWRLGDSLPAHLLKTWSNAKLAWMSLHPEPWSVETEIEYHKQF